MERIGNGEKGRSGELIPQDELEQEVNPDDSLSESNAGLGARLSQIKGQIAAALLSIGIPAFEMPSAHAIEPIPTALSEKIVTETLSAPVIEKIREQGLDVRVTLPRPEGAERPSYYVVHVGQLHEATLPGLDRMMAQGIVNKYQRRLYEIYEPLLKACSSPIFREGFAGEELYGREKAEGKNKIISDIIADLVDSSSQSVEEALALIKKVREYNDQLPNLRMHPQAQKLSEALGTALGRVDTFFKSLPSDAKEDRRAVEIGFFLQVIMNKTVAGTLAGTSPQFRASSQLYYEYKADLFPAEDFETNQRGVALFKQAEVARQRIEVITEEARAAFEDTLTAKELESLFREVQNNQNLTDSEKEEFVARFESLEAEKKEFIQSRITASPEYQELSSLIGTAESIVHDERETAAYAQIEKFLDLYPNYGGDSMKCAVVEYGNNHTFAESAEVWNVRPDVKVSFGIIEIYDPTLEKSK